MANLSLQEMIKMLSPELQSEVQDFAAFLLERKSPKKNTPMQFAWEGVLSDLKNQYTSVQLQHQISEWRGGFDESSS